MTKKRRTRARRATPRTPKRSPALRSPQEQVHQAFVDRSERVEELLLAPDHARELEAYFGAQRYQELKQLASEATAKRKRGGPKVLIVPGIMGSEIGTRGRIFDDAVWFDPLEIIAGRLTRLALPDRKHEAIGVLLISYANLYLRLLIAGYSPEYHAFDWRQDIGTLGKELAKKINSLGKLRVVAHSMGGLVTRAAMASDPAAAARIERFVMLGTPNHGSFAPVLALDGVYPVVKTIAALDRKHDAQELARRVFATFPGLVQMLPTNERYSVLDLYTSSEWPKSVATPPQAMLARTKEVQAALSDGGPNAFLIAGCNQATITDLALEGGKFKYTESFDGDGTVPLAFATLPNVPTYYYEGSHGNLPNYLAVIQAVENLLERGDTAVLPKVRPPVKRAQRVVERKELDFVPFEGRKGEETTAEDRRRALEAVAAPPEPAQVSPAAVTQVPATTGEVLPLGAGKGFDHEFHQLIVGRRRQRQLEIQLALGSITEVKTRAYVLGLFKDVDPTGAAAAIDAQLDGAIKEFTARRMFSGNVGETFVLPAGRSRLRADMVLFTGLGPFDGFDSEVQQFVAQNVARTFVRTHVEDFATVLLGAGSGQSVATSLFNHLQGFFRGLADADVGHDMRRITLCEMNPERFLEIKQEIYRLASTDLCEDVQVTFFERHLPASEPPPATTRALVSHSADMAYLMVREEPSRIARAAKADTVAYRTSLLSAGGKATVISGRKEVERKKLAQHLESIEADSFDFEGLPKFGRKLVELVVDDKVATAMQHQKGCHLVVVHDALSSVIPWETLCFNGSKQPWFPAGGLGLSRRYDAENLSIAKWLEGRKERSSLDVLLVVNPTGDLPGAEKEAKAIRDLFPSSSAVRLEVVERSRATRKALLDLFRSGRFDVLHYAGHAQFDKAAPARSGILCAGHEVLSGADLAGISNLPALVFFNACESGRIRGRAQPRKRVQDNVGLAEAFLRGGVANYVGTYWPVGDDSAKEFAEKFYTGLIEGKSVGEALASGRKAVQAIESVDWVDYIHYGSPDFVLKRPAGR